MLAILFPSDICDHSRCWLSCLDPLVFLLLKICFNYLAFQALCYGCALWRLFQKRVVRTKFDIYVLYLYYSSFDSLFNNKDTTSYWQATHLDIIKYKGTIIEIKALYVQDNEISNEICNWLFLVGRLSCRDDTSTQ